jgi:hypothetical protein
MYPDPARWILSINSGLEGRIDERTGIKMACADDIFQWKAPAGMSQPLAHLFRAGSEPFQKLLHGADLPVRPA